MQIYKCKCGKKIGVLVPAKYVVCDKCQKKMSGHEVTDAEMKRVFPEPKQTRRNRGTKK